MEYVSYAIFDNRGVPVFDAEYATLAKAFADVGEYLEFPKDYADLFPVTIEGLTRSDIYERIAIITCEVK